jgi:YVTN family beta-propeller protein
VDADTYKVKRVIHAGNDPEQLAISADGTRLYVANEDAAQVSVVDVATGTIATTVKIGEEPEGVTIRPDGKVVYVTSEGDGAVFAIDTQTNKVVRRIPVGPRPRSVGFLPRRIARLRLARERWRDRGHRRAAAQVPAPHPARRQGQHAEAAADGDRRARGRVNGLRDRRIVRAPLPARSGEERPRSRRSRLASVHGASRCCPAARRPSPRTARRTTSR